MTQRDQTRRISLEQQRQLVQQALAPLDRAREQDVPFDEVTKHAYNGLKRAYYILLKALTDLDQATMPLRRGMFSIDDGGGDTALGPYAGYTRGQTWNGWACPYFTKEVADQLAALWNREPTNGMGCTYDAASDTYTFLDTQNDMEPDTYTGEDHEVNGQTLRLYPIGNGSWVWDEDNG